MTTACENEKLCLYYNADTAQIGLEDKESGYVWLSEPPGAAEDAASQPVREELQSTAVLTSCDRNHRSTSLLRSKTAAEISVEQQPDGLLVTYDFTSCGITVPVQYILEENCLTVRTETSSITESMKEQGICAAQLALLGSFGAGCPEEDGCFVVPDGCGALIRFHNGKDKTKSYSAVVYGRDLTAVPAVRPAVTEQVSLPVYGIVRENGNTMTVIADEGSENVTLNATVSGQSLSSYDLCGFTFQLRGSDTYYMPGAYGTLTVFEEGDIKPQALSLHYYPSYAEEADFTDIAAVYRDYLTEKQGVKPQAQEFRLNLNLYGGTMKKRSFLGIPLERKTVLTDYGQAQEIVSELHAAGAESLRVRYHNWTDASITGKADDTAKPAGILGGAGAFRQFRSELETQGDLLCPSYSHQTFRSGGGYSGIFDGAVRISGAFSRQAEYGLAYGTQDSSKPTRSLLSPRSFAKLYRKLAVRAGNSFTEIALDTSALWGDYGRKSMGRSEAAAALQTSYRTLQDNGLSLETSGCAAYALPYAGHIGDLPLHSGGFDIFDEEVPFCQAVLHGLLPFACEPVNADADADTAFLTAVAYGCEPSYDMLYAPASLLKDTALDHLFYANYAAWTKRAASQYSIARAVLSEVGGQTMTGFSRKGDCTVTTYADGTEILVNFADKTIAAGGKVYALYSEEETP